MEADELLKKRITELAEKAYQNNIYTFSSFLGMSELSDFYAMQRELSFVPQTVFGGYEGAERCIIRFGSEELFGYPEEFPVVCLKIRPLMQKFADDLGHRDFLGALMNLGIDRSTIGDIKVGEKEGYLFCLDTIAFIKTIPEEYFDQTDPLDNHANFITSDKNIIYWLRPENKLSTKNRKFIEAKFEKNKSALHNKFALYPDIKQLADKTSNIRNLELEAKCKNDICIDTWLYKRCNKGYCVINPQTRKYYKVRTKESLIPKAKSLINKW